MDKESILKVKSATDGSISAAKRALEQTGGDVDQAIEIVLEEMIAESDAALGKEEEDEARLLKANAHGWPWLGVMKLASEVNVALRNETTVRRFQVQGKHVTETETPAEGIQPPEELRTQRTESPGSARLLVIQWLQERLDEGFLARELWDRDSNVRADARCTARLKPLGLGAVSPLYAHMDGDQVVIEVNGMKPAEAGIVDSLVLLGGNEGASTEEFQGALENCSALTIREFEAFRFSAVEEFEGLKEITFGANLPKGVQQAVLKAWAIDVSTLDLPDVNALELSGHEIRGLDSAQLPSLTSLTISWSRDAHDESPAIASLRHFPALTKVVLQGFPTLPELDVAESVTVEFTPSSIESGLYFI